ncbi:MAG: hypothetical protein EBZ77_15405 [Chitinophagia bacterium]|nr:hypothetical protein [Chitinophagia bacterium]
MVVHTIASGSKPSGELVLQLMVNGQVKSAASLDFSDKKERTDTLAFTVNDASWQQLQLYINDAVVRFDDTFRIGARSSANLSVLALNEGQFNPYVQAAFRAYNGFRLNQVQVNEAPADWNGYNLIILNGITAIGDELGHKMDDALQRGQTICLFPGKTSHPETLNSGLHILGDIALLGPDTAVQTVATLQQGSALVRDLFERVPDNVQLPVVNWHYRINAGLTANQQSVLSFRNGDPMFARYTPTRGQLFVCATVADMQAGNFAGSYFFAPFLYQMAIQSGASNIIAVEAGSNAPVYLPMQNNSERNTLHLYGNKTDVVPPQRPNGGGIDVFPDQAVAQPGFYTLAAPQTDTALVAINPNNAESVMEYADLGQLKANWKGSNIKWPDATAGKNLKDASVNDFPLWKVCIALGLVLLALETILITRVKATVG